MAVKAYFTGWFEGEQVFYLEDPEPARTGEAMPAQGAVSRADADAAREQYRVARRLAAEGSPEARSALQRVVALDPGGELADDARVEQARLDLGLGWPEGVGGLDAEAAGRALALLDDDGPTGRYIHLGDELPW